MNDKLKIENFSLTVVITELLFVFAVFLSFLIFKINPINFIHLNFKIILIAFSITILLTIINIISIEYLHKYFNFFKKIKETYNTIVPLIKEITFIEIIIISLVSGFSEELFFRGLLQPIFGIIAASILFGLFHIENKKAIPYGIYACLIGLLFGYLFKLSNNLFLPILIHIFNNFIALNYIKYYYAKNLLPLESTEETKQYNED